MNDLFLLVPFVALLVFSVLERKMDSVNGRAYVFGIFALYTIQALFIFFGDSTSEFSIFTCHSLYGISNITIAILIVRIVMLFLTPVAHKIILKIYSLGMISFLGLMLIGLLISDSLYIRYIHHSIAGIIVALIIDILFHIALFFFSDLLNEKNKLDSWLCFLDTLMYSVFRSMPDDEYFDEITSEVYDDNKIYEKESRNKLDMVNSSEYISEEVLKSIETFEMNGEDFLLDSPENAILRFNLKHQEGTTTVSGCFTHTFVEEQAAWILKKKSVLNKTFKDIDLKATSDTDIGVESIEEGTFTIKLDDKTFDTSGNYNAVRNYILGFMNAIIIIQNTESY
jgi:hypothetical protein